MKLYYAPGATSLAPHIVLRETGCRFDLERVEIATRRTAAGADLVQITAKDRVPVLELDGALLTEVPPIVQYLADLVPEKQLAPPNGTLARYQLQDWLCWLNADDDAPLGPVVAALAVRPFLVGDHYTVADACLFARLRGERVLPARLADYARRIEARPATRAALAAEGLDVRARAA